MQARETRSMHLGNRFFFQVLCCLLEDQRELRYLFGSQSCLACLICWWNNLEEVEMDSTCPLWSSRSTGAFGFGADEQSMTCHSAPAGSASMTLLGL